VLVVCWSVCLVAGAAATQGEEVDDVRHQSIRGHSSVSSRCERWVASRGYHTHSAQTTTFVVSSTQADPEDHPIQSGRSLSGVTSEVCIFFSTAGMGSPPLSLGDYVREEWFDSYGMTVEASASRGGYTPDNKARIYDTSCAKEDPDLGSPNKKCGGPGVGT
jgi:hypothetical protein